MANLGIFQPPRLLEPSPHNKSPSRYLSLFYGSVSGSQERDSRLLQGLLPRIILEEWNFKHEDIYIYIYLVLGFLELAL